MSSTAFRAEYFEKLPLLLPGAIAVEGYDWQQFSADFYGIDPAFGTVRIYRDGAVDRQRFQRAEQHGDAVQHRFNAAFFEDVLRSGGTLVVNRFEKSSAAVARLCAHLARISGYETVGNAYATAGGTGTFGKHWDTHCVFAAQLVGAKRWKLYRPTIERPLSSQTSRAQKDSFEGELFFEGVMSAGDLLYVPRGWWHEVTPLPGCPSLHISVGVHSPKVHEYVKWILTRRMTEALSFRHSLGADEAGADTLRQACEALAEACLDPGNLQAYLAECRTAINPKEHIDFNAIFSEGALNATA